MEIQELADILDGRRFLEVEIVESKPKLKFSYDPFKLTDEVFDRLDEMPKDAPWRKVLIANLAVVGLEWGLAVDGVIIPTTEEGLRKVSTRALSFVWDAILEDSRGKAEDTPKSSEDSAAP